MLEVTAADAAAVAQAFTDAGVAASVIGKVRGLPAGFSVHAAFGAFHLGFVQPIHSFHAVSTQFSCHAASTHDLFLVRVACACRLAAPAVASVPRFANSAALM